MTTIKKQTIKNWAPYNSLILHLDFPIQDKPIKPSNWRSARSEMYSYETNYTGNAIITNICFILRKLRSENLSMEKAFIQTVSSEAVINNLLLKKRNADKISSWNRAIISYCISIVYRDEYQNAFLSLTRSEINKILFIL